jgi:hypothetical protein
MKKVLGLVVAGAMATTLAVSAAATWNVEMKGDDKFPEITFQVAGGDVLVKSEAICYSLVRGVRFTFDLPGHECDANSDDEDATGECDSCVGVAFGHTGNGGWGQEDFCYDDKKSITIDLSAHAWQDGVDGAAGTGLNYLNVSAASHVAGNAGTVKIEVLGEGNKVLARGAGYGDEAPTTPTVTNPPVQQSGGEDGKQATGMGGVAVLGAVAILAAGAVVVSRKRK